MTGRSYALRCVRCDAENDLGRYDCARCAGVLVVDAGPVADLTPAKGTAGVWRYPQLLPSASNQVSIGEGQTPLIDISGLQPAGRDFRLYAKLEGANPTLSFKDRGMALAVSIAVDRGCTSLVVASTGNAAVSASAYAAAAGLSCTVIVGTASNAANKLAACRAYGAKVSEVDGDYSTAYAAAMAAESETMMNVSTTYRNPVLGEGYRSVALELVESLGRVPDAVIVPIGAGSFLRAIAAGFRDVSDVTGSGVVPRMVGVQADRCAPLARAWDEGRTDAAWERSLAEPLYPERTSATAIADPLRGYEDQGLLTLEAVRETHGTVVAVSEDQIDAATQALLSRGIWVEPAAATAVAALAVVDLPPGSTVVSMMTGHGVKATVARNS
ncbi:pyridoxal-phosphate dependent enzyme (plasmid) [Arthrobacter sp. zg-Y820]|uniref:pyridoxal-phosphate dependent enzyme n=1 Tax=unclassified Arthrobacter TaxID=235627 RepID=UPI001E4B0525|nr:MULTISPECIES: pyridoxal-phosphate dependent enzyme [unclassified Arthrobacter]MCC9198528.1 pyridoxal-phosphate dependent enzyme [Arthrobacter sp. zg-Y820]MDK1281398.1 pyridoxal-phosphate dependent enzyme [Arthrobacter sp. zg.Y820]WIB11256.1 pyridoxal-phosphate dependent enzyme [Arthrobacter sp. zg-Y820]